MRHTRVLCSNVRCEQRLPEMPAVALPAHAARFTARRESGLIWAYKLAARGSEYGRVGAPKPENE